MTLEGTDNQAYHYLKLGGCNPIPKFLISLVDLGPTLIKELAQLEKQDREFVVKQAVGRIFEDIALSFIMIAYLKF